MSKPRILIADDNQANAELLEAYLADCDYELAFACDGVIWFLLPQRTSLL